MQYHEIIIKSINMFKEIIISESEVSLIEEVTRDQARNNTWFHRRAGLITASKFHAACTTDISRPSKSLILSICYPMRYKYSRLRLPNMAVNMNL